MTPIITLLNQKGGVGKSSTCHHLAGTLALRGLRILLIDNDPQSSLTQGLWGPTQARGLDPAETLAAVYRGEEPFPDQIIRPSGVPGVDLIAGSRVVNDFNLPRPQEQAYEAQACIRGFLEGVEGYDLTLIDCPPNLCLCSWAALTASTHLIVPLQAEDYGAQGIMDVQDSVSLVRSITNPGLQLLGYLITMFAPRKTVHKLYEQNLRDLYGVEVFASMVPHAAEFPEAIAYRKTVAQYKPKGAAAKAVKSLADEVLARLAESDARCMTREVA